MIFILSVLFTNQSIIERIDSRIRVLRQEYYGREIDDNEEITLALHQLSRTLSDDDVLKPCRLNDEDVFDALCQYGVLSTFEINILRGSVTAKSALPAPRLAN